MGDDVLCVSASPDSLSILTTVNIRTINQCSFNQDTESNYYKRKHLWSKAREEKMKDVIKDIWEWNDRP